MCSIAARASPTAPRGVGQEHGVRVAHGEHGGRLRAPTSTVTLMVSHSHDLSQGMSRQLGASPCRRSPPRRCLLSVRAARRPVRIATLSSALRRPSGSRRCAGGRLPAPPRPCFWPRRRPVVDPHAGVGLGVVCRLRSRSIGRNPTPSCGPAMRAAGQVRARAAAGVPPAPLNRCPPFILMEGTPNAST